MITNAVANIRTLSLVVFGQELADLIQAVKRSLVTSEIFAPSLGAEVVSSSQGKKDHCYRKTEHCTRQIMEYWTVNLGLAKVTVLTWLHNLYQESVFVNNDLNVSHFLRASELRSSQLSSGGRI